MSLRRRLVLLSAATVAIAICVAATGSYIAVRGEMRGQVDDVLRTQGDALSAIAGDGPGGGLVIADFRERIRRLQRDDRVPKRLRRLLTPSGTFRARVRPPEGLPQPPGEVDIVVQRVPPHGDPEVPRDAEQVLPVGADERQIAETGDGSRLADVDVDGEHLRMLTVPLEGEGAVQMARSLEGIDDVLERLRLVLALIVAGGVAVAAVLAQVVSRRVIAPITHLTDTAEHISLTRDLSRRIEAPGTDEVGRLAARFNSMLNTIEDSQAALGASVAAQRQLVADASHELRTPVSSLRTDIETLLRHPELPADERRLVLTEVDTRIDELGALIGDVIELARGEEPDATQEDVRLDEVVSEAVARMERLAAGRRFEVKLEPTLAEGRPDRLLRAVNNLLDNANKYSPPSEPIEVSLADGELRVRDRGPGIPADELDHVFDRFYRGAGSRHQPGSGLGLAIVRQVAESHGGDVGAENPDGGGAVFRFRVPTA